MNHPKTKKLMEAVAFSALVTCGALLVILALIWVWSYDLKLALAVQIMLICAWIAWARYMWGGK